MENIENKRSILTPENIVIKVKQYVETLKHFVSNVEPYPINREILTMFSFYMDYAVNRTNLAVVKEIHKIITYYYLSC